MSEEPAAERVDGRFVLEALAGRGGMGEVWRARDEATGETVALKLLLLTGRLAAARFATEVSLLRDATHANLVRYLAHGEDARRGPWLAMEWIEGTPLDARLERGALSALEALALIGALADGLASLHARGTVHRDLKPENVLLVGDDPTRPKLVDFGVARTSSARHTRPGMVVGTPGYIAPEQIRGEPVDARADVFALGTLLYECLAGRPAFEGEHPLATFTKTLLDEPVPLPALRPDLPSEIADLAHALLAKEPAARPSDAAAVAALLAQAGRGGETVVQVSLPRVGDDERRMVSLLVGQRPMDGGDQTLDDEVVRAERARLLAAAARFGATVEVVTSNSFAVTVPRGPVGTDAPRRAVRCALALGRELPDHAMAVATTRADTSLTGGIADTIERATRLLPSTPGAVAVDDATAALLDGRFVLDEGRADDRLRVVQERAGPPLPRAHGTGAPFVGRERPLSTLAQTWAEAVERARPRAAVVVAEGGAGKSRLALELWPRLSRAPEPTAPPTLAWAQADPLRTHVPFAAAAALIRELFGLGEAPTRDALRALGRAHGLDDARAAPLVELSPAHATPPARTDATVETEAEAEPSLRAARVREAAVSLLHARARRGPVLLVVDDAHHADEPSLRLLDEALKPTEGAALLVLALGTPDLDARHPGLFARRASVRLSLPPLAPEAARALVRAALPTVGASTLEGLLEEAEGNPFHLEELARARAEGATQSDSLLSMMETRIARLDPEVRRVLRAASVFGERFDAEGVAHLLARSGADPATGAALRTAVEAELLVPEERAGAHRFRHRLLREAAYAMLPEEDRRVGHRLAAEHLEDAPGAHAEEVAMHLSRAGDEARAVAWLERAARDALRGDDLRGARRLAERGIALRADAGTLHRIAAQALVWLGRTTEALARAEAALATTETGSVDWLLAASVAAVAAGSSGAAERLEEVAEAVLPLAADDDAPAARAGLALALTRAANQLFFAGRLALARRVLARLEAVLDGVDDPAARARLAQVRGIAATYAGDRVTTLAAMREAAEGFEAIGDRRSSCVSLANLGSTLNGVGLFDEAEEVLRRALALSEALELAAVQVPVRLNLSLALLARGQAAEAAELAREATEAVEGSGDRRLEGATRLWWARALLAQGRVEDARARVEAALAPLAQVPTFRALAFAVRARCALATGQVDEALADSGEAMALLEALGALDEGEALVRLVRLEALEATGRAEEAAAVLRDAVAALDAAEAGLPASLRAAAAAIPEQAELRRRATSQGAGRRGGGSMSP